MSVRKRFSQQFGEGAFLAGSAVYFLSNILNAAIPFALLPVLTRYLSPAEYGQVAMFQTLGGALAAIISLSIAGAAGRKYYDDNIHPVTLADFVGSCLQILAATTMLALLVMLIAGESLAQWLGLQPLWLYLAVLATAAMTVIQMRLNQWQVRKQARRYGVFQVVQSLLNVWVSLLLVVMLEQGAVGRLSAEVGVLCMVAVLALWSLQRDGLLRLWVWRPEHIKEALHFGIPLMPHFVGIFLLAAVDRLVINAELGLVDVGIYMVAVQLAGALKLFFDAINKAYVPWLYELLKRNRPDEKLRLVRYTYIWFVIILLLAGCGFVVGPWGVALIAGQRYAHAGEIIGWLVLGQVFGGMYLMVTNYVFYSKRTGLLSVATITSGFVNIGLLLLLIPTLGLRGAAIAFCGAMALRFALTWWVAQLRHPMPWFDFGKLI